ncbi:inorganic pyrophosphatase domain-containing protein [Sarocladium implicatum]|nr:inorganic pyrophosphatase domain-containing protein [Sarocladium implicatum]
MPSLTTLAQTLALLPAIAVGAKFDYDSLSLREVGARNTIDWRVWLEKDGEPVSFWHDIPLYADKSKKNIISFYVEIPRWTDAKIETKRDEPLNPIFHDTKNKEPRFVESVWPHKTYPILYGSVPQTWEDPNYTQEFTGFPGDNDPVDLFDVSGIDEGYVGQVKQVKILGALGMIDDESTDWKVIAIDIRDPVADLVDSVEDLEHYRPGLAKVMHDWFIYYKVARGSGLNTIVGNAYVNASFATSVISDAHGYWENLMKGKTEADDIMRNQTSNPRWCQTYVDKEETTETFGLPTESKIEEPAKKPEKYDYWYYLDEDFQLIELPELK